MSYWPFVGRADELAIFRAAFADASCRGVLVCGPSGVGKTRLAEEFLALGRVTRIDLFELSRDGVEELLSAALGAPVEAGTFADFHAIGRGNILFPRELVLGALTSGRLVDEQGVWRLTGPLTSTAPLADLVEAHLRSVEPQARSVLEYLALVGAAGLSELTTMVSARVLERLERAGLVTLRADRRRQQVTLAHPLYGEVLCDKVRTWCALSPRGYAT